MTKTTPERASGWPRLVAVLPVLVLISLPGDVIARSDAASRFVEYVYVDANEGSASGGHVALRLGDRTYHFGYHEPGVLRIDRDDSDRFDRVYGVLENRNREISRIEVSPDTFDLLRSSFNERYLEETAEFELLDGIVRDRRFFEEWQRGNPAVELRAAGYFQQPPRAVSKGPGGGLGRLRARILERHGVDFLASRISAAREDLAALSARALDPIPVLAEAGRHPARGYGLAGGAREARGRIEAFTILEQGAVLDPQGTVSLGAGDFVLDGPNRAWIEKFARGLEGELVETAASSRPDVGFVLLVGMARLLALEATLVTGHLTVLDVFPPDAVRLSVDEIEARGGRLAELTPQMRAGLQRVGKVLSTRSRVRESDYAALEATANRFHELERSEAVGADLRASPGRLLPRRPRRRELSLPHRPSDAVLADRALELRAREEAQRLRLDQAHHYNLLTHNCASEIFAQIERSLGDEPRSSAEASQSRLGGHVPPGQGLEFIPFVAAGAVQSHYAVDEIEKVPSYRTARVSEMAKREGMVSRLRESNTLTSTVYTPNRLDSSFLFFTDDAFLLRPVLGVANIAYGLGAAVAGLPLAPFDDGSLLVAGLRGVAFSLPELAFANIRKGSFFSVPSPTLSPVANATAGARDLPDSPERGAGDACAHRSAPDPRRDVSDSRF